MAGLFGPLLRNAGLQAFLKQRVQRGQPGPSAQQRKQGSARLWGEASDGTQTIVSRLRTPEVYQLTVLTALASVERTLNAGAKPGFQTPSLAFGPDFVLSIAGVERQDS
jgi:short subunit dehydrogenase-like uncharacterized protein